MKTAIDNNGIEVEVSDDTTVRTVATTETVTVEDTIIEIQLIDGVQTPVEVKYPKEVTFTKSIHYLLTPEEQAEIDQRKVEWQAEAPDRAKQAAKERRRISYPAPRAEADVLWHYLKSVQTNQPDIYKNLPEQVTGWVAECEKVKADNPIPE